MSVKRSVHEKAGWGDGRSRMTLAHELAHGVMHYGATVFRSSSAMGSTELSRGNAAGSAEHQAKVFASAFLIDDKVAAKLASAEEISAEFVVSLEAAEICLKRLTEAADRAHSAERVRQSNEAFQAKMQKPAQQLKYTGDFCRACGNATLLQIGIRLVCHTCRNISDPN
jgi:Zn-dependent peptidase ImmA (M78 family)